MKTKILACTLIMIGLVSMLYTEERPDYMNAYLQDRIQTFKDRVAEGTVGSISVLVTQYEYDQFCKLTRPWCEYGVVFIVVGLIMVGRRR